jgi:nucleoid DNA-binding protein
MNSTEFTAALAKKLKLSRLETGIRLDNLLSVIVTELANGRVISIDDSGNIKNTEEVKSTDDQIGLRDLTALLSEKSNIAPKDAKTFVKKCFKKLIEEKPLTVGNLGTFDLVRVEDSENADVSTGEKAFIPVHYEISFSPDTEFAIEIEAKTEEQSTEPACFEVERYEEPVKRNKNLLWIVFIAASVLLLAFAGYYWRSGRQFPVCASVSHSVDEPPISDSSEVAISDNQPVKTFENKQYKVLDGERLTTIALREYGHKIFWVYIYDENRDRISNPDLITPEMIINIPPAQKYGIDKDNPDAVNKAFKLEHQYKTH